MIEHEAPSGERGEALRRDLHLYQTVDDLPEQFQEYVQPTSFMPVFHHPVMVEMMPLMLPASIEEVIRLREEAAEKYLKEGNFSGYLTRIERPYRLDRLLELEGDGALGDTRNDPRAACRYWKLAASYWVDAEHDESDPIWMEVLEAAPHPGFMTDSRDRRWLRAQPETLTLYRGVQGEDPDEALDDGLCGVQWTTSRDVAVFFAKRFLKRGATPYVLSAPIKKADIVAYLTGRGEYEAIVPVGTARLPEITVEDVTGEDRHAFRKAGTGKE
jgi:hypothetical protein